MGVASSRLVKNCKLCKGVKGSDLTGVSLSGEAQLTPSITKSVQNAAMPILPVKEASFGQNVFN